jgi:hypothetical protein
MDPAEGAGLARVVVAEALDVVDDDRQMELQEPGARPAGVRAAVEVGLAERHVPEHLLRELDAGGLGGDGGHVAAASAAGVGSRMRSEKRSASAAIVKLGFGPVGPGITEPSAMCRPG